MAFSITSTLCTHPHETQWNHSPADYHILYVNHGSATFTSDQDLYHVAARQVLVISLNSRKIRIIPNDDFEYYLLTINDPQISELIRQHLPFSDECMRIISLGRQQNALPQVFHRLNVFLTEETGEDTAIYGLLEELLVRLHRAYATSSAGVNVNCNAVVSHLQQHLLNHYDQDFDLKSIAAQYNLSCSYLSHAFKEITGTSIMRYLISCRIFAAKEYLVQTALPISVICKKCGFNDTSNFGRTFRKAVGCSPRQYRQTHSCDIP